MTIFNLKIARMQNIPKVDELKVNWDDNCTLFHKKYSLSQLTQLHHMTLNTIFSAVILGIGVS